MRLGLPSTIDGLKRMSRSARVARRSHRPVELGLPTFAVPLREPRHHHGLNLPDSLFRPQGFGRGRQ